MRKLKGMGLPAALAGLFATALAACGGGNGPQPNQSPTASFRVTPNGGPPPLAVVFDASASADRDGSIASYQWEFGAGIRGMGRTVEHTFGESGRYSVRLTVTDDRGASASAAEEILVNATPVARISADPVGGTAPIRVTFDGTASSDADGAIASYDWTFEPGVTGMGGTASHVFSSPGVHAVRLNVTDDLGGTDAVEFEVNVEDGAGVAFTVPYVSNGAHAGDLRPCLYPGDGEGARQSCNLAKLPFIGTEYLAPSIEDLMTRVLVSHRWMGDNLKALLERLPEDALLLARSLTGIVVASDIRPAHYRPDTGAIYLDADFLWRTPEQLAVVTQEPDYRAAFARKLQFLMPWRFVRNNQRFTVSTADGTRNIDDVAIYLGYLLFHELSHAADFAPAAKLGEFAASMTVLEALQSAWPWPSSRLTRDHPLRSNLLKELAAVSFVGVEPTPEQAALLPGDLVDEFSSDGAVDYYSYSSQFEDLADLHTAALMSRHFGQETDTAITDYPLDEGTDLTVAWGQRGRMTDPNVIDRTRWIARNLYPGDAHAMESYLINRPRPLQMRPGDTWTENIILEGGGSFSSKAPPAHPTQAADSRSARQGIPTKAAAAAQGPSRRPGAVKTPRRRQDAQPKPYFHGCIRVDPQLPEEFKQRLGL